MIPKIEVQQQAHGDLETLLQLDNSTLDPNKHYRWIRAEPLRVGKARIKGYTPVQQADGVRTIAGYLDDTSDGTMRIMDVILMCCDLSGWRERKRASLKVANSRLSAPKKQFKRNARRRRVRILNEEDE